MKEVLDKKTQEVVGYRIGNSISIHQHIHYPGEYLLTIRELKIHGQRLCSVECTKEEIARYVNVQLQKKRVGIQKLIAEVLPYT